MEMFIFVHLRLHLCQGIGATDSLARFRVFLLFGQSSFLVSRKDKIFGNVPKNQLLQNQKVKDVENVYFCPLEALSLPGYWSSLLFGIFSSILTFWTIKLYGYSLAFWATKLCGCPKSQNTRKCANESVAPISWQR